MFLVIKGVNYDALYFLQNYVASILAKNGQCFSSWGQLQFSIILKKIKLAPQHVYVKTCTKLFVVFYNNR